MDKQKHKPITKPLVAKKNDSILIDFFNKPYSGDKIIYKVKHYPDFEVDTNTSQGTCDYLDIREYKFSPLYSVKGDKKFLTEEEAGEKLRNREIKPVLLPTWKPIHERNVIEYTDPNDPRAIKTGPREGRVKYLIARNTYSGHKKIYEIPLKKGLWFRYKTTLNIVIGLLKGFDAMQRYVNTELIQEIIDAIEELRINQDAHSPDNMIYAE